MDQANLELLEQGVRQYGVTPGADQLRAVAKHLEMVADWNQRINLTAITDERGMVVKHAIDSASAFDIVELAPGMKIVDVGTGAGFPGITLKCLMPEVKLTLLDSLQKRCKFLELVGEEVVAPLGGPEGGFKVAWGRAEDFGQNPNFREQFDVVFARAVAELRVLAELCLPLCKVGGVFIAMKGPAASSELSAAEAAISTLGGMVEEAKEITLPDDAGNRTLIRIKKTRATPKTYPRQAGTPSKKPL